MLKHGNSLQKEPMPCRRMPLLVQLYAEVCEPRHFSGAPPREGTLNGTCQEVVMRGGDVMYLPYSTLHEAYLVVVVGLITHLATNTYSYRGHD